MPPPAFTFREFLRRAMVDAPLKAVGTTLGMTGFFVLYFAVLRHPRFPVTRIPETWLDRAVGFQPWSLLPYVSLWFYISLVPALLTDRRQIVGFAAGSAGLAAAGLAIFFLWPTAMPAPDVDWTLHPSFQFLRQADAAGNACPSLHAAFAVFTGLWFARLLPTLGAGGLAQAVNLGWAFLIVHSTLATKQHVALDALSGAALGAWAAALNFIATPCRDSPTATPKPLFLTVATIKLSAVLLWLSGIPFGWSFLLFLSGAAPLLHALFAPNAQGLERVFTRFATPRREFWLTIDDGPDPEDTPRLLAVLARHDARATFFLIGERAARHPELVAEILRHGHEIAHHTQTHPGTGLWAHSSARLTSEFDLAFDAFAAAGVPRPLRFRAPMGIKNLRLGRALADRGLVCVGWSLRSFDSFTRNPATVAIRVLRRLRPGVIVLMHEGPFLAPAIRVEAVRQVLAGASAQGYRAVIPAASQLLSS